MRDSIEGFFAFCIVVGLIGGALYGVYLFIHHTSVSITDQRCSTIAWRAAQTDGVQAGKAADAACRKHDE